VPPKDASPKDAGPKPKRHLLQAPADVPLAAAKAAAAPKGADADAAPKAAAKPAPKAGKVGPDGYLYIEVPVEVRRRGAHTKLGEASSRNGEGRTVW
jgi:hypothetical protein